MPVTSLSTDTALQQEISIIPSTKDKGERDVYDFDQRKFSASYVFNDMTRRKYVVSNLLQSIKPLSVIWVLRQRAARVSREIVFKHLRFDSAELFSSVSFRPFLLSSGSLIKSVCDTLNFGNKGFEADL